MYLLTHLQLHIYFYLVEFHRKAEHRKNSNKN